MKRLKGVILSLVISILMLNSVFVGGNIYINGEENPNTGGGFTIQQDPNAKLD